MSAVTHPQLPLALPLRESSTLDGFLGADHGPLLSALTALIDGPVDQPGQLYVWGDSGTGRSHLLEAAVRSALQRGLSACLLSAEEMLTAHPDLLEGLEQMALLAIDDIQLLAGQPQWEEALFHLYNRFREQPGRLLFSALGPPGSSGFRLSDLSSRLAAGPVYQISGLTDRELRDLLVLRARARGLELPIEVAEYIVVRSERSPAALVEHLNALDHSALVHQRRLTVPFVKAVLGW